MRFLSAASQRGRGNGSLQLDETSLKGFKMWLTLRLGGIRV
jgi:hypothetical protein